MEMKDYFLKLNELARRSFLLDVARTTLGVSVLPSLLTGAEPGQEKLPAEIKASC